MNTSILQRPLFGTDGVTETGLGFHNIGSGVLRASKPGIVEYLEYHYGERCGHVPLSALNRGVLVKEASEDIDGQVAYLSGLFGLELGTVTSGSLKAKMREDGDQKPLIVPYINVPEAEHYIQDELGGKAWGLPGKMTHVLKNKASFYQLAGELGLDGFVTPDYQIAHVSSVAREAYHFLKQIEEIYMQAGFTEYPLGIVMRAAESDGNYGCCIIYEYKGRLILVQDGDSEHIQAYNDWHEALAMAQECLSETMNTEKETRVVMSRYIDFDDSPGMSVVISDNQIVSLGWNGQLQEPGSKACVGTSSYTPPTEEIARMQSQYEEQTTTFFESLLRKTADRCNIDFATIHGVANLDIMLPGARERELQRRRKQPSLLYLAECNPRWTNYTDAILTIIGVQGKEQTIQSMQEVISQGIATIDKHHLSPQTDPRIVRELIKEQDNTLKTDGTRIICRMAKNPLGLIFAGDIKRAQHELEVLLHKQQSVMPIASQVG